MNKHQLLFLSGVSVFLVTACSAAGTGNTQPQNTETVITTTMNESIPENIFQETGMLKIEPGYIGTELGATIESIVIDEETQVRTIYITVPIEPAEVDTIKVLDKNNQSIPQSQEPKIIRDYENNNVGVKLFVSPKNNIDFKIKFINEKNNTP